MPLPKTLPEPSPGGLRKRFIPSRTLDPAVGILRRGISPIVATVILVAAALVIALAVVAYLVALVGELMASQPQVSVTNFLARIAGENRVELEVYMINAGAGSDRILLATVTHGGDTYPVDITHAGGSPAATPVTIPAGFRGWVRGEAEVSGVSPGDVLVLRMHFERSGTYVIRAVATR